MQYFRSVRISDRIIRIIDCLDVAMYLVIGKQRACLIDTGNGIGDLYTYVKTLTELPVFVILTHGHFDHIGGSAPFETVYMHPSDQAVFHRHSDPAVREMFLRQLPEYDTLAPADFAPMRRAPFLPLHDEQLFDLGGVHIKMIAVPGHTQGMMMALIVEERMMLFGDACGVSVLLFEDTSSCVSAYRQSLYHVKHTYAQQYDRIIRNHGTFESPLCILDHVIDCCSDILKHADDHIPTAIFGHDGFFTAKQKDAHGERADGKTGNIVYRFDKAC